MIDIQESVKLLSLSPGDFLVDSVIGTVGILMELAIDREVDGYQYDSQFWKIYWVSRHDSYFSYNGPSYVEEYGLKMSIAIGIYDYFPVNSQNKQEKI